ncbi:MAG: 7-carboxy-7-deazaguanine synthase QueE [Pirellulales bacterium]
MQVEGTIQKGVKLRICEIYASLQGEGLLTGTPSLFVRTSGCNLRCWFCDTPFASWRPEGEFVSVSEAVKRIGQVITSQSAPSGQLKHVVLTGGEPMICVCRTHRELSARLVYLNHRNGWNDLARARMRSLVDQSQIGQFRTQAVWYGKLTHESVASVWKWFGG